MQRRIFTTTKLPGSLYVSQKKPFQELQSHTMNNTTHFCAADKHTHICLPATGVWIFWVTVHVVSTNQFPFFISKMKINLIIRVITVSWNDISKNGVSQSRQIYKITRNIYSFYHSKNSIFSIKVSKHIFIQHTYHYPIFLPPTSISGIQISWNLYLRSEILTPIYTFLLVIIIRSWEWNLFSGTEQELLKKSEIKAAVSPS